MKVGWSLVLVLISIKLSAQEYLFVDSLNYLNKASFQVNEYGFDGLGCNMTAENLSFSNGNMQLKLDNNHDTSKHKPFAYNSAGIQGIPIYKYGYFCTRMKSEIVKGSVSSFFLMNKWVPNDWIHKEIDIEFLGKNLNAVQLTNHLIDTKTNNVKSSTTTIPLEFSIALDFHDFCILWTADSVAWFADKTLLHVEKKYVPDEPMQILMNHWNADSKYNGTYQWLGGAIDSNSLPSIVSYDWITVQSIEQYIHSTNTSVAFQSSENYTIFPNPASNKITLSTTDNCDLSIFSIDGIPVKQWKDISKTTTFDISDVSPGMYVAKIISNQKIVVTFFIKL